MTDGHTRPDHAGPDDLGPGDLGPGDLGPGEPVGGLSVGGPQGDELPGDDLTPEALAALLDEFFGDDDEDDPGPHGRPAPEADGPPTDTAARPPAGWAAAHAVGYDDAAGLAPALGPCEPRPRVRHAATADRPGDGADRGADGGPPFEPPQWGEGPGWDDARRRGHPLYVAMTVAQGAAELRSYLARGLAEGEVSVDQPLFRPYRAGFGALADRWATEWRSLRPGPAPGWARLGPSAPGTPRPLGPLGPLAPRTPRPLGFNAF